MLKKEKRWIFILIMIALLPLWMFLAWYFTSKKKWVVAIIDKTVLTTDGQEHISLTWLLNHKRLTKTTTKTYQLGHDYFGFFPKQDEKFRLKGLERFSSSQINQLSDDANMVYFTDTYGIYTNEWYKQNNETERSGIVYGGMGTQDISLLKAMKQKHKLIVTEFNSIGSPTASSTRNQFEQMFGMKWSGWVARYFESLDTSKNKELPRWLIKNYTHQHGNKWPFKKSGIAFVSIGDQVEILEDSTHLDNALPHIISSKFGQDNYSLPEKIKYAFWFDIIIPNKKINTVVSMFDIAANDSGKKILRRVGIPLEFPAVIMHKNKDYRFYYFSGDFCDNPISMTTSYFKGIGFFRWLFYNENEPLERASFFWKFYKPLISKILEEEQELNNSND